MGKPKLVAAIAGGVAAYLREEEEGGLAARAHPPRPPTSPSQWGQSGRQEMMQIRRLMQMRFGRR